MLAIEQHTLRYLENNLRLRIKRDERGDRLYTEKDIETLRLVLQLKEKGLNTTAIRMALDNVEETKTVNGAALQQTQPRPNMELAEIMSITARIMEQNDALLEQNKKMEQRLEKLEKKIDQRNEEREKTINDFLALWKAESEGKSRSWISRLRGK